MSKVKNVFNIVGQYDALQLEDRKLNTFSCRQVACEWNISDQNIRAYEVGAIIVKIAPFSVKSAAVSFGLSQS